MTHERHEKRDKSLNYRDQLKRQLDQGKVVHEIPYEMQVKVDALLDDPRVKKLLSKYELN